MSIMLRVGKRFVKSSDKGVGVGVGVGLWLSRSFSLEADRRFLWLTTGLFVVLWICHAWLSDDACMTLRQVLNFTEGHGVVWNWGERVQAFTHPAWFLLLSVVHVLSGGLFEPNILKYSSLFVSLALSMSALWLFLREMQGLQKGVVVALLLALLSSQAFIDYTSSGLENPLSYFLVVLICSRFFSDRYDGFFFFLCALLFLNRMDYALLLLPLCLYAWRSCGYKFSVVFPAASLCLLWLVFATWYFGHPLPNTFLAKSNIADVSVLDFAGQALLYYFRTLTQDPVTLFVIFLFIASCFYSNVRHHCLSRMRAVGAGVVLYGIYLLWIGGDFMQGRFFAVPFFFVLCGLAFFLRDSKIKLDFLRMRSWKKGVHVVLLSLLLLSSVSLAQRFREAFVDSDQRRARTFGVSNQRRFYLRSKLKTNFQSFRASAPRLTTIHCCPGAFSLLSNGSTYIVDPISLTSPYLSRIPGKWGRIGHMFRTMPTDFEVWLLKENFSLLDPKTNAFFSDIRHVVQGNLFSWNRMKKIAKINLYDYKVDYFLKPNNLRFSRLHLFLQQKVSLDDLIDFDSIYLDPEKLKNKKFRKRGAYNITQSVSIALEKRKIKKISFPVFNITEYTWFLYDGQKKVYEDFYKTDKRYSFHTFTLPKAMRVDRIVFVGDKGIRSRRQFLARPLLE